MELFLLPAFYQPLKLVSADGTISEPKVNIQDFERCIQRSVLFDRICIKTVLVIYG